MQKLIRKQLAIEVLDISYGTLAKYVSEGSINLIKEGKQELIDFDSIKNFINTKKGKGKKFYFSSFNIDPDLNLEGNMFFIVDIFAKLGMEFKTIGFSFKPELTSSEKTVFVSELLQTLKINTDDNGLKFDLNTSLTLEENILAITEALGVLDLEKNKVKINVMWK
jgi:hypothetical protein